MLTVPLLCTLFCFIKQVHVQGKEEEYNYEYDYEDPQPLNCSTTESIRGGNVSYSQGGLPGSVLTYHCSHGYYPSPVSTRQCGDDGEWSTIRPVHGRLLMTTVKCKEVSCPGQLQLDNGEFWPRVQWFRPGTVQSFSCQDGFTLSGSRNRTCTISQEWTGTNPTCDNYVDLCKDPGIPPGALRSGARFRLGDRVHYRCQAGMDLLGSSEQACLESRVWTGSTPQCQAKNSFDSLSTVAEAMTGSLSGVMDVMSDELKKKTAYGRTIDVTDDSRLNIYILLDTSGSITKQEFEKSREAIISLIRRLDSYEVQMKFHVTSFASNTKDIVEITDTFTSEHAGLVIEDIRMFNHGIHGNKTGTNLYVALQRVNEMMAILKQGSQDGHFEETQHVIILLTDGYSNTGINPQIALARIRSLLGYSSVSLDHTAETLLDIYVFGVGEVDKAQLNAIASKKNNERHVFILKDYKILGEVFNSMINDKSTTMCGVAQEEVGEDADEAYTRPWHVTLKIFDKIDRKSTTCYGSIVSPNWILTSAHCFARSSAEKVTKEVKVIHGMGAHIGTAKIHPNYNISALKPRNVSEFYDYDVALVRLNGSIPISLKARPICLPCTAAASRALKKVKSTCEQHRNELLAHKETLASFIHKGSSCKQTVIHTEDQRQTCVTKASVILKPPTDVTVDEYVPDRFLCSGYSSSFRTSVTCKGDSGGSLFLQKGMRYFQVGVVSWGTKDVCNEPGIYSNNDLPPDARDFHISLFSIVPWLKTHLGQEIEFLPVDN